MEHEFIVVGGGPAGAACAIALQKAGAQCLLLERSSGPSWKPGEIIDSSIQLSLRELGVWEEFQTSGSLRSSGTHSIWNSSAERPSALDPLGGGFFVCRHTLEQMLLNTATACGVRVIRNARVVSAHRAPGGWSVTALVNNEPSDFQSKLLIEATGRSRGVACSSRRNVFDNLVGLIAYSRMDQIEAPDLRFNIEAAESGWWYSAALPGKMRVVAFLTDADLLPSGRLSCIEFFKSRLAEFSLLKSQRELNITTVHFTSANTTLRSTITGDGWVALADAAATYDPLMGLGVPVALSKGLGLARLLKQNDSTIAIQSYLHAELEGFSEYLKMRTRVYRLEKRWRMSPFWQRRHSLIKSESFKVCKYLKVIFPR